MKAFLSQVSFLAILAVFTAAFTSNIMAQRRSGDTVQPVRRATPVSKTVTSKRVNSKAIPVPELAAFDRVSKKAKVIGNDVLVEMVVSMYDVRPSTSYVWGLKVKSPDGKQTLSSTLYRDQVFTLQGEKRAKPTFSEHLVLDSGRYMIQVVLYEFPTGFNLDELANPEREVAQRASSGILRVTIP